MRLVRAAGLVAGIMAALSVAPSASAQLRLGGMNLEGEVETGARFFLSEPSKSERAKFEEYRDITEGLFLDGLRLRIFRPDERYSFEFDGSKWGQEDQEFSLRTGRLGLWEFGFDWDQTPHIFSTNARMLATETSPGVFTLPTPRPALSAYNTAPEIDEIGTRWDTARLNLVLTPAPDLELKAEYSRIFKDGDRAAGMVFGSPGSNFIEVLEPIEQTIQDFRLKGMLAREQWQLQLGYHFSLFQNSHKSLVADNPCFGNTGCSTTDAAGPATGLVSLAPDNMAHTVSIAGGVNLPLRTRVNANAAYSFRFQNETFLPHTINPGIMSDALALPQQSLDGLVGTALFNLNVTSRPFRLPLTLSLRYRFYDLNDMTDDLTFAGHVQNDNTLVLEERTAGRFTYMRQNLDIDGRWRFTQPVTLTLGTGWERWDRNEHREVPSSDEVFGKAVVQTTPSDWLLARLTYRPSIRRTRDYDTFAHLAHTVEDPASDVPQSQSPGLVKFDEGDRDRQRVDLELQLTPTETFTTTLAGGWRYDDYLLSTLGLQKDTTWSAGIDFNWQIFPRVSIFAGYVHEWIFQTQRSQNRPVTSGVTLDVADYDWTSDNTDTIDTFQLGMKTTLIPKILDWTVTGSYSYALGRIETTNLVTPTSGTTTQDATATAKPFPAFEDSLLRVETALAYHFAKSWTATFSYVFESFENHDWRTDTLDPFVPGATSIWLGSDLEDYTAHIVGVKLTYRFN